LIIALIPSAASATVVKRISFEEKVQHAHRILVCQVIDKHSRWNDDHSLIVTDITLKVTAKLKGSVHSDTVTITIAGGDIPREDEAIIVSGAPEFEIGEEKLLFLLDDKKLYCPVLGWKQGAYKVFKDPLTKEKFIKLKRGDKTSPRFRSRFPEAKVRDEIKLVDFLEKIKAEDKPKKNGPKQQ